jgi:tryptophanase
MSLQVFYLDNVKLGSFSVVNLELPRACVFSQEHLDHMIKVLGRLPENGDEVSDMHKVFFVLWELF